MATCTGRPDDCASHSTKEVMKPAAICWTINTGSGKSLGSIASIVCNTGGPPVEAPIAITFIFAGIFSSSAFAAWGKDDSRRVFGQRQGVGADSEADGGSQGGTALAA